MTVALYGLAMALIAVMRLAPHSPLSSWLLHHVVRAPIARISALQRHQLIFVVIVAVMLAAAGETIAIYGSLEWALISAFDLSVYLDAIAVTAVVAIASRARGSIQVMRGVVRRLSRRPAARARCSRPANRRPAQSSNDDDPAALPLAA